MGMFDDVPMAAPIVAGGTPAPSAGMFDDVPMAKPGILGQARDIGKSVEEGGNRAIAGVLGLPADLLSMGQGALDWAQARGQGRDFAAVQAENNANAVLPRETLERFGSKGVRESMAAPGSWGARPEYKPQTTAGEYGRTVAEFTAGAGMLPGGSAARTLIGYGAVPGAISETAGQLTEGTAAEPWARAGAGLAGGLGAGVAMRPSRAERTAASSLDNIPVEQREAVLARAQTLLDEAQQRGVPLSVPNALDAASGGVTNLSELQRHVEAMGGMRGFYAQMPEGLEGAARGQFDTIAPTLTEPSRIGPEISDAARSTLFATPEGQAFTQARNAVAARVSPDQGGQVIQRELTGVVDQREAARRAQADVDYAAARAAPENIGIERRIEVERPGEPIVTQPGGSSGFLPDAPAPLAPRAPAASPAPAGGQPEGFTRWLAARGGIPMDADSLGQDLNRAYIPGAGTLARRDAPTWDQIRVRLAEEGWQPSEWAATARDADVKDYVINRVRQERQGGGRQVRMEDDPAAVAGPRGQQADEYRYAVQMAERQLDDALERVGVSPATVQPEVRSRALNALVEDPRLDPLDAYERVVGTMREPYQPYVKTPTIREEIADVQFGQVNPQPVLDRLRELQQPAKGATRAALRKAERELYRPDGQLDLTVEGLHGARRELDDAISEARRAGRGNQAGALIQARRALDEQLKSVPEVATADANFARNSRPLEPFAEGTPLGRITQRDPDTGRQQVPAEQVPSYLSGATAAREFLANATPRAREAFEGRVLTEIVDAARRPGGEIDADALRSAMRQHEDVLRLVPGVADRVRSVAVTRETLSRLDQTMVGQLARRDLTTRNAVKTLFPDNPLAGSEGEVGRTVGQLARRNPTAARQLVRVHGETLFNRMAKDIQSGPNAMGGAKFAAAYRGDPQAAANHDAAMRALPNGDTIADGFSRFLDVLEATGRRQAVGSRTAYNAEQLDAMKRGNLAERAASQLATGGFKLPAKTMQRIEEWRLGRNLDALGRLFSDPDAVGAFRGLLNDQGNPVGSIARLVAITMRGEQSSR